MVVAIQSNQNQICSNHKAHTVIETATHKDIPELYEAMKQFASEAPVSSLQAAEPDMRRVCNFLSHLIEHGVVLVAKTPDSEFIGMLIAQFQPDTWIPEIITLRELAWWVKPEHRGGSAGYRLLKEYEEIAERMIDLEFCNQYTITLMSNSPNLDLTQRGWHSVETNYIKGI